MEESRLKYNVEKPLNYSNRVLIGSWVEERSAYKKNNLRHSSSYSNHYSKKPYSRNDPAILSSAKLKAEGFGIYPEDTSERIPNFFDNFSTTYDLGFNHFPKWYGDAIYRDWRFRLERHDPFDEYIESYGNITDTGLSSYKQDEWRDAVRDPRTTATSAYEETYISPENAAYKFRRWPRPKPIKTKEGDLMYEGYPKDHPSITKCNPVSWECKEEPSENCL